jgi:mannose-6-phosphate isomerase-like protein (cupin superfamily)
MKTILKAALIMFILSGVAYSQDWAKVNPEMNNIVTDTALVRATIATIEPGKKSEFHTHPAMYFYAITDCVLKVYYEDGQSEVLDLKAGDSGYGNPEKRHQTENIGQKTAKFLLVELKEHPYIDESTQNK